MSAYTKNETGSNRLGAIIPLSVFCFGAAALAAWLAPAEDISSAPQYFLERGLRYLFADSRDRYFYTFFCVAALASAGVMAFLRGKRAPLKLSPLWRKANLVFIPAVAALFWYWQTAHVYRYFSALQLFIAAAAGVVISLPVERLPARLTELITRTKNAVGVIPTLSAVLLICSAGLLPAIFTERALEGSFFNVYNHIPYTMAEFAAVLNGRTLLVNFFPQYQNLLPYLLAPVFKVFGLSVLSFTLVMAALSAAGLACIWLALRKTARSELGALAMFTVVAAAAFYPQEQTGTSVSYMFNYYAVGPLRYLGPWVLTLALAMCAAKGGNRLWLSICAGLAAASALNNMDFGLAAAAASMLALLHTLPNKKQVVVYYLTAGAIITALYSAAALIHGGALPDFAKAIQYQRVFGLYGFMAAPMPVMGIHLLILGTFAAALITGASLPVTEPKPLRTLLLYSGLFGLAAFAYYSGRSLPGTLQFMFPAWALCAVLLARAAGAGVVRWFMSAHAVLFILGGLMLANPFGQIARLNHGGGSFTEPYRQMLEVLRQQTKAGETVIILGINGHRLAIDAGVKNAFPFASQDSLILKSQLTDALGQPDVKAARIILGPMPDEMRPILKANGYHQLPEQDIWLKGKPSGAK